MVKTNVKRKEEEEFLLLTGLLQNRYRTQINEQTDGNAKKKKTAAKHMHRHTTTEKTKKVSKQKSLWLQLYNVILCVVRR